MPIRNRKTAPVLTSGTLTSPANIATKAKEPAKSRRIQSIRINNDMADTMVKIKVPLPANDASGGEAEWMWADANGENRFTLRNIPVFAFGLSYGDTVSATIVDGVPVFANVAQHNGHSTYRIYLKTDRHAPEILALLDRLKALRCDIEVATDKVIAVDVLPDADVYAVYAALQEAEQKGIIEFEEGHCGHPLTK